MRRVCAFASRVPQFSRVRACHTDAEELATFVKQIRAGNRRMVSRAITLGSFCFLVRFLRLFIDLVGESSLAEDRSKAARLMSLILKEKRNKTKQNTETPNTLRIGISGPPGVGKSSFLSQIISMLFTL